MPRDLFAEQPQSQPRDLFAPVEQPPEKNALQQTGDALLELAAGVNRGAVTLADLPLDAVNAALEIAGSDKRIPTLQSSETIRSGIQGGFVDDPTAQQAIGMMGEFLAPAPPVAALSRVGGVSDDAIRMLDDAVPGRAAAARELQETPMSPAVAKYELTPQGSAVKTPALKEASKQGVQDEALAVIKNSAPDDKNRMRQMLDIVKKGLKDPVYQQKVRPASVAGKSLSDRVSHLQAVNREAGSEINKAANNLKGVNVDLSEPIQKFADKLDEFGVALVRDNKTGGLKADFTNTSLGQYDRGPMKEVIRQMSRLASKGNPDANDAHQLKRIIDNNVGYGAKAKSGLGAEPERALKEFRAGLNESIGSVDDAYKAANAKYKETKDALESIQKSAGANLDFSGTYADEALGTSLRRLLNNTQARANMMGAIDDINSVANKYGGEFSDDLTKQMIFADELDHLFETAGRTSFKGQIGQAVTEAGRDAARSDLKGGVVDRAFDILGSTVEKARGINEENAIKSLEELLK